jgi:hypothetical protein
MTSAPIVLSALVLVFATLFTAHVTLLIGLAGRPPRRRALLALVAPPLAPWLGWHEGMRARCLVWVSAAIAYAIALTLAAR